VRVTGEAANPLVLGDVTFRRGFVDFLGQRFTIREGRIEFDGARPPVPAIDLTAAAQAPELEALLRVQGRADDVELELTSVPPVPQDEVLAQLLFRRDTSQISPFQALRLANAVAVLEGGGVDAIGRLRELTGFDTLDIGGETAETTGVSAGKYIADNVFVEVGQGIGAESGRARVEIELTPHISAVTEVTGARSGARVEWRFDY
jgi:translocation and assembly module TamB